MQNLVGLTLLNTYQVQDLIGEDEKGQRYKAWDTVAQAYRTLDVLRQEKCGDPSLFTSLRQRADRVVPLKHPHLVRQYGVEQSGDLIFWVSDYVDGVSLRSVIAGHLESKLSPEQALRIIEPVCAALGYAHSQDVIHGDLRPANILISWDGHAWVTGFGLAPAMDPEECPSYVAPEVIQGSPPAIRSDIYALGAILYEMLSGGVRPFIGDQADIAIHHRLEERVAWEQVHLQARPLRRYTSDIPLPLEALVMRSLEKDPRSRPGEMIALGERLSATLVTPSSTDESPPDPVREPVTKKRRINRNPLPTILRISAGLGILLIISTIIALLSIWDPFGDRMPAGIEQATAEGGSSGQITLTEEPAFSTGASEPAGVIAYVCFIDGIDQVCTIRPDGTDERRLTGSGATSFYPSISADGQQVYFSSRRTGNFEIYVMSFDGSDERALTAGDLGSLYAPDDSPDGSTLVFTSYTEPDGKLTQDIWLMDADGSNPRPLTHEYNSESLDPVWSPDGIAIAFSSNRNIGTDVYVMNADGSDARQITFGRHVGGRLSWSPDGRYLAYYAGPRGNKQVFIVEVASGEITQLTFAGDNKAPCFSPDGEWIVFTGRDADGDNEIFIMRADGSDIRQVTFNTRADWQPRWGIDP